MARGNCVVVTAEPKGQFQEGKLGAGVATAMPGQFLQIDYSVALIGGRHTYILYAPGANGGRPKGGLWILCDKMLLSLGLLDGYVAGEFIDVYCPANGDELNALIANIAGTADSHPLGQKLMIENGTGKLIAHTGTTETQPLVLKEALVALTADVPAWVDYSGY